MRTNTDHLLTEAMRGLVSNSGELRPYHVPLILKNLHRQRQAVTGAQRLVELRPDLLDTINACLADVIQDIDQAVADGLAADLEGLRR